MFKSCSRKIKEHTSGFVGIHALEQIVTVIALLGLQLNGYILILSQMFLNFSAAIIF